MASQAENLLPPTAGIEMPHGLGFPYKQTKVNNFSKSVRLIQKAHNEIPCVVHTDLRDLLNLNRELIIDVGKHGS
jgi:hypothetical protein